MPSHGFLLLFFLNNLFLPLDTDRNAIFYTCFQMKFEKEKNTFQNICCSEFSPTEIAEVFESVQPLKENMFSISSH